MTAELVLFRWSGAHFGITGWGLVVVFLVLDEIRRVLR